MNARPVSLISTTDEELHLIEATDGLVFSPDHKRLHFPLNRKVLTLDIETQTIIHEYPLTRLPRVAGTSPDDKFLYVSEFSTPKIQVINTHEQTVKQGYEIGLQSVGMVVSHDGSQLFAASSAKERNFLWIIDSTKQTLIKSIEAGRNANSIAIHPSRPVAYIACFGVVGQGKGVYAIDTSTYQVTHIPLEGLGWNMALSPTGDELYVSQSNSGPITVIDTVNNGVKTNFMAGESPRELSLSLDGERLYVIGEGGKIDVFNTRNQQFVRTIDTEKKQLTGITTRKDGALWVGYID
jgi:YVTN family beta-propeller protein